MTKNSGGVSFSETAARLAGAALGGTVGLIGGPKGAVMGGIVGAAAMDATMSYIAGRPIGQVKTGQKVIQGEDPIQNLGKMGEQAAVHGAVGYCVGAFVAAKLGAGALATGAGAAGTGAAGAAAASPDSFWNDSVSLTSKLAAGFGAYRAASSDVHVEKKEFQTSESSDRYDRYYRSYSDD